MAKPECFDIFILYITLVVSSRLSASCSTLCNARSTYWGSADDRQHLDGFIWCSVRQGYCASDLDIVSIIDQADKKLFQLVLTDPNHVLSSLLPDKTDPTLLSHSKTPQQTTCWQTQQGLHMLYTDYYWFMYKLRSDNFYGKILNIIHTIFPKWNGLVAGVRIIHVN